MGSPILLFDFPDLAFDLFFLVIYFTGCIIVVADPFVHLIKVLEYFQVYSVLSPEALRLSVVWDVFE